MQEATKPLHLEIDAWYKSQGARVLVNIGYLVI